MVAVLLGSGTQQTKRQPIILAAIRAVGKEGVPFTSDLAHGGKAGRKGFTASTPSDWNHTQPLQLRQILVQYAIQQRAPEGRERSMTLVNRRLMHPYTMVCLLCFSKIPSLLQLSGQPAKDDMILHTLVILVMLKKDSPLTDRYVLSTTVRRVLMATGEFGQVTAGRVRIGPTGDISLQLLALSPTLSLPLAVSLHDCTRIPHALAIKAMPKR